MIFTSDNGTTHDVGDVDPAFFDSVAGLRGLKGDRHEGGVRVPNIVRWPDRFPAVADLRSRNGRKERQVPGDDALTRARVHAAVVAR